MTNNVRDCGLKILRILSFSISEEEILLPNFKVDSDKLLIESREQFQFSQIKIL